MIKLYTRRRKGIGNFFEEIPALIVAIAAIIILLSSILLVYNRYNQEGSVTNFFQEGYTFMQEILNYHNLTYRDKVGVFDVYKETNLTNANITYDLHPPFGYFINITDVSGYSVKYNHTVYSSPIPKNPSGLKYGIVTVWSSVTIWVSSTQYHAAILVVTVWE